MQNNYAEILSESLQLRQAPVAISFTDALPDGLARPQERVAAGCRFWQDAADKGVCHCSQRSCSLRHRDSHPQPVVYAGDHDGSAGCTARL